MALKYFSAVNESSILEAFYKRLLGKTDKYDP